MLKITWPEEALSTFVKKAQGDVLGFATEVIQDLNNEVVISTPVDTGYLQASWLAGLNDPPTGVGGSGGAEEMNAVAATLTIGDIYYAVNTAVYAARIEWGFVGKDKLGRVYNQAGRGWVRAVVARAQEIADAAAARVGSRK